MTNNTYDKLCDFLVNADEENITAGSAIYQLIEDEPWTPKPVLKNMIGRAVSFANNQITRGSSHTRSQFEEISVADLAPH
ncbi:6125_t:CDS:2 [Racocetra fulgida]|uniref:6125_t:CDS:1 n=1 Tax=Racocetra fulgida TaxID=60492 RepID=A0A9N9HNB9_9GLOM|nr:6125_t:CDS:2 [Racocetra fulgida]